MRRPSWLTDEFFWNARLAALVAALVGYYLPWVWHAAAALTFNAYDLAEWVSLPPGVREGNPPLVAPFLLRIVLVGLALLVGLYAARARLEWVRWSTGVLALILALTVFPPLDFFRTAPDDPNYRQGFGLSILGLIGLGAIVWLTRRRTIDRLGAILEIVIAVAIIVFALMGEAFAFGVVQAQQVAVSIGGGVLVLVVSLLVYIVSVLQSR